MEETEVQLINGNLTVESEALMVRLEYEMDLLQYRKCLQHIISQALLCHFYPSYINIIRNLVGRMHILGTEEECAELALVANNNEQEA